MAGLLASGSRRTPQPSPWPCGPGGIQRWSTLPTHSGGTAPDSHRLPDAPELGRAYRGRISRFEKELGDARAAGRLVCPILPGGGQALPRYSAPMKTGCPRLPLLMLMVLAACSPAGSEGSKGPQGSEAGGLRVLAANASAFDLLADLLPREQIAAIPATALEWSPLPGGRTAWEDFPVLPRLEGELILSLDPDILIVSSWSESAPIEIARQAGIQILELEDASSWPRLVDNIRLVGSAVDAGVKAEELIASLESRREALADSEHPPLRILPYSNFGAGGRTSGGRTTIDLIIQLAGHRNAASEAGLTGHPDLDLEQVLTLDPDAFLTSTGRDGVHPGSAFLRGEPVLEGLRALQTDAILELQAELYATASHRVIDAAEELAELVNEMR